MDFAKYTRFPIVRRAAFIRIEREFPWFFLGATFISLQYLFWLIFRQPALFWGTIVVLLLIGLFIGKKSFRGLIVVALAAYVTVLSLPASKSSLSSTQRLLVYLDQEVRHPRPGELRLSFKVKDDLVRSSEEGKVNLSKGDRILCRAPGVPWKNIHAIKKFDIAVIEAQIDPVPYSSNPFSYESYLHRRAYVALCRVSLANIVEKQALSLRSSLVTSLQKVLGTGDSTAVILAMLLGVRDLLSFKTDFLFKSMGLNHILVVSGFHVGIFYYTSLLILNLIASVLTFRLKNFPFYYANPILAFLVSLVYVHLSDYGDSSIRALIAIACLLVNRIFNRGRVGIFPALTIALVIISVIWPCVLSEPGMQLSIAALSGIGMAQRALAYNLRYAKFLLYLFPSLYTGLVSYFWFNSLSWCAVFFNILFVPIFMLFGCQLGFVALLLLILKIDSSGLCLSGIKWVIGLLIKALASIDVPNWGVISDVAYPGIIIVILTIFLLIKSILFNVNTFLKQYNLC